MRSPQLISIVIPVFNEEEGILSLERRLTTVLATCDYNFELILVDDGSSDGTLEQLKNWQSRDSRLVIVKLSRNWGHQNALNAGLDLTQGNAVIFMDGDLEDPPEIIPKLLAGWEEGYDTVYTVKTSRNQTYFRRILTNGYYRLVKTSNRYGVEPQAGMFSLVDQKVAMVLRQMKEAKKSYPNLRSFTGFKQKQIPYSREARAFGKPKQLLRHLISDGLNGLFSNTYLPIRIFTVLGVSFSVLFLIIGIIVLGVRITGYEFWIFRAVPGTQLILLAILMFGSMQIAFLGILGEYIARIYEESKGRPYYVIDEIEKAKPRDEQL